MFIDIVQPFLSEYNFNNNTLSRETEVYSLLDVNYMHIIIMLCIALL